MILLFFSQASLLSFLKANWMWLLVLTIILGAFIFLRSKPSNVDNLSELEGILTDGQPTVIEFYSNY